MQTVEIPTPKKCFKPLPPRLMSFVISSLVLTVNGIDILVALAFTEPSL